MDDLRIPQFATMQGRDGNWRVQYKWWHPVWGFCADTLIIYEHDRERLIPEAQIQIRQLFKELKESLEVGD
jgi:hypothetical protein